MLLIKTALLVACGLSFFVDSSPVQPKEETNNGTSHSPWTLSRRVSTLNVSDLDQLRFHESTKDNSKSRTKRSLSLVSMVQCGVSEDCGRGYLIWYGSYCGPLGSGVPIDDHDRCCQAHDACYTDCYDCWTWEMYLARYNWDCYWGIPYCFDGQYDLCRRQLCECDRQFVACLNRVEDELNYRLCSSA